MVIGAGIVGVSTAWQLQQRHPNKSVLLVDKEPQVAQHQTGHNSGVIHAGVYYPPESLKADFCRRGSELTKAFCCRHQIPYQQCGKLIVATTELELERLDALFQRCTLNGVAVERWDATKLRAEEPNVIGLGAIFVAATGIVDYQRVTEQMLAEFVALGGEVKLGALVCDLSEDADKVTLDLRASASHQAPYQDQHQARHQKVEAQFIVVCAGLMADRMAAMMDIPIDFQIVPYRGEYFQLPEKHNQIVKRLIYPVPDPELPFLGVHLTRMIDGTVTVGPNAVQGWKREGYGKRNFNWQDTIQMLMFSGFWKVSVQHWRTGLAEWRDAFFKKGYLRRVHKYCPQLTTEDLQPYPAGVRAQAVMNDGRLVHDFLFASSKRSLHVCNAPSPAATSAIPIGEYICDKVAKQLNNNSK